MKQRIESSKQELEIENRNMQGLKSKNRKQKIEYINIEDRKCT